MKKLDGGEQNCLRAIGNDVFEAEKQRLLGKEVYYRLNAGTSREWDWTLCEDTVPENMTDFDWAVREL